MLLSTTKYDKITVKYFIIVLIYVLYRVPIMKLSKTGVLHDCYQKG